MTAHPLRVFRQQHQMSPAALARLLGVSRAAISRWESGQRAPGSRLLPRITERTGIPAATLRPDLAKLISVEAAE